MSSIVAELEGISRVNPRSKTPQSIIRGARRRVAKAALQKLKTIIAQDNREARRGEMMNYTPLFVGGDTGTATSKALYKFVTRLEDVLAAKN